MEYSKDFQFVLFTFAAFPYSIIMFLILDYFNWQTQRNKRLCDMLLNIQIGVTIVQGIFLLLLVSYVIYFRNDI